MMTVRGKANRRSERFSCGIVGVRLTQGLPTTARGKGYVLKYPYPYPDPLRDLHVERSAPGGSVSREQPPSTASPAREIHEDAPGSFAQHRASVPQADARACSLDGSCARGKNARGKRSRSALFPATSRKGASPWR